MKSLTAVLLIVLGALMLLGAINTVITDLPGAAIENEKIPGYLIGWCVGLVGVAFLGGFCIYRGVKRLKKVESGNR